MDAETNKSQFNDPHAGDLLFYLLSFAFMAGINQFAPKYSDP